MYKLKPRLGRLHDLSIISHDLSSELNTTSNSTVSLRDETHNICPGNYIHTLESIAGGTQEWR